MGRLKLSEMKPGATYTTVLMIRELTEKKDKNGRAYLVARMSDGENEADMFIWDSTLETCVFRPGSIVDVVSGVSLYNDKPSFSLKSMTPNTTENVASFIPSAPVAPETLYAECLACAESIGNESIRRLVTTIFSDYKEKLLWWGAAKSVHHTRTGELLWHMTRMKRLAEEAARQYDHVDRDILMAGILLHDIGKLHELETNPLGITDYTVPGQLCGHAYLGAELVRKYAQKLSTPPEAVRLLVHIILSHHGKPEYGAVARPSTIEAAIVHFADMMDSHLYIYEKEYEKLEPGMTGDSNFFLDNTKVYRPQKY